MPLRLQALYAEVQLPLSDQPTVLGRSRTCLITSTSVSRHACSCFQDGDSFAKVVAAKRIYIKRKGAADAFAVNKDDTQQVPGSHFCMASEKTACCLRLFLAHNFLLLQMGLEDTVYLAVAEGSTLQYGFKLLSPDEVASTKDNDKVLAAVCAHYWQAPGILCLNVLVLSSRWISLVNQGCQPQTAHSNSLARDVLLGSI